MTEANLSRWIIQLFPFQARDALVSNVSSLVVRTVPESLVIEQVSMVSDNSEDTIEVLENTNVTLRCRSVGGKPPPRLSWQLPDTLPSFSLSETVQNGSAISVISALPVRSPYKHHASQIIFCISDLKYFLNCPTLCCKLMSEN